MIYVNTTNFVLIISLEKDNSITETRCLKNVVIFIQTIKKTYFQFGKRLQHFLNDGFYSYYDLFQVN